MATAAETIPAARLRPTRIAYYVVIPNPSGDRALLLPEGDGWTLPGWEGVVTATTTPRSRKWEWHDVAPVDRALRERFGLDVRTLRCLYVGRVRTNPIYGQGYSEFVYEVEPAPADWTPPAGGQWVGHEDLRNIRLTVRGHLGIVARWLDETDDPETAIERPDWYRPGWFAQATAWIEAQLSRLGLTATTPPEQIRSRERSCEIRVQTDGGRVRFKALPEVHGHEPALTDLLAKMFPGQVPQVLARDDARRWMLYVDVEGAALEESIEVERLAEVLRRYARLQIASIPRVSELRRLGVPSRPVRELPRKLDALLADLLKESTIWPERPAPDAFGWSIDPLRESELDQLRDLAPSLKACCADLARSRSIPDTLDHGNFWPEYVTPTSTGLVISDWSDSAIGHPFFSPWPFLLEQYVPDPEDRRRLRESYLEPWGRFAPRKELDRLFELAQRCYPLQYAAMYHGTLLPAMSARWEKEGILRFALRVLITLEQERKSPSSRQSAPSKQRTPATAPTPQRAPHPGMGPNPAPSQSAGDPDLDKLLQLFGSS